ncbi:glycosyltransferase family 2 protein [Devosia sp.]|uniref:glycosyltransferase family 2 protein n=1 Tax=Devosia sp. TaxID=1871048 RepID=UPI001AD50593|nr:glycosyltransferase family 2 protein [Devosia sp.]MBN9332127.1 glycosyltransferase family 2 protein [Devosia sp.]
MAEITIGIPTYNRPAGLRQALESIEKQSLQPDKIIVSDNASTTTETEKIAAEFADKLPIQYFRQKENLGAKRNFIFLLEQADTKYFMWLADDDAFGADDTLLHLYQEIRLHQNVVMTFPDVDVFFDEEKTHYSRGIHSKIFGNCQTNWDYLRAFAGYGGGHCFYGLYDRKMLESFNLDSVFDSSIAYFNEGVFLHTLFLNGGIRFVPKAKFTYNGTSPAKISSEILLHSFQIYSEKVLNLYSERKLKFFQNLIVMRELRKSHSPYIRSLERDIKATKDMK